MAVAPSHFYRRFRIGAVIAALLLQVAAGLAMAAWSAYALDSANTEHVFLTLVAPFVLLQTIVLMIILLITLQPVKVLTDAIAQLTQEAGSTPPPDLSHPKYRRNGLHAIVQALHTLRSGKVSSPEESPQTDILKSIVDNMPVGVILLNDKHQIIETNERAPLHKNPTDLDDLNLFFDQHDVSLEAWLRHSEQNTIKAQKTWLKIPKDTNGDAQHMFYDVIASYNKNGANGVEALIVTINRTAEYAPDEEAMDFMALAAHELRGPITVIHGYLDVLAHELHGELGEDHRALLDRLTVSSSRLSGYVNNILNASKFDRRHLRLYLREYKVQDIYASVAEDLNLRARTQNRLLSIDFPSDLPTVAADKNSIGEVITNLVDNGIKYSFEGGQVVVKARAAGDFVEISVADSGIGMPANVVQKLFTKFYRSHRSRETVAGAGLGLYISKAIVESHGGTMSVRTVENHGSIFTFTLPIYQTVADKLLASDNRNDAIIESSNGWIKNHAMYRG